HPSSRRRREVAPTPTDQGRCPGDWHLRGLSRGQPVLAHPAPEIATVEREFSKPPLEALLSIHPRIRTREVSRGTLMPGRSRDLSPLRVPVISMTFGR